MVYIILKIIGQIGTAGGTGYVIEYSGEAISKLSMEARMTICNMSIEAGARAGLIAPDEKTFQYINGRPYAPKGKDWDMAVDSWKRLPSDKDAVYDKEVKLSANSIEPQVTWGTSPQDVAPINGNIPDPKSIDDINKRNAIERSLEYMGLKPIKKLRILKLIECLLVRVLMEELKI